jgi:hypothetical protein
MRILIVAFAFQFVSCGAFSQCDEVLFTGKVTDTLRPQNFYNLMVINRTTGRGVFGRPNGSFSVYASLGDTMALSVKGYPLITLAIYPDSNCQFKRDFYIESNILEVQEVVVKPLRSLEEIREEREALAIRETRLVTGIDVLQSPITALYQAFSRKEQSKRWVAEQEYKDDQRRVVRELLRNYVAFEIVDLSEEEFDEFIAFLNIDENFLKTASEMELITFIKDKFEHYKLFGSQR